MHTLESNSNIPTFILKIWKLVCDPDTNDLISWNRNGHSFIIKDQGRFSKEILPLYFKHNNMASFIRQLNMYGFRKVSNIENSGLKADADEVEFYHPCFTLGHESQLQFIKRKMSTATTGGNSNKSLTTICKVDDIQDMLADIESIKGRQNSVDTLLNKLKQENEALWREIAVLRQKHQKQQQIVEKLLQFLMIIVRNHGSCGIKRKTPPLLIDSNLTNRTKIIKTKDNNNAICIASPSSSTNGPIIHEISDLEDKSNELISGLVNFQPSPSAPSEQDASNLNLDLKTNIKSLKDEIISIPEILSSEIPSGSPDKITNITIEDFNKGSSSTLNTPKISLDDSIGQGLLMKAGVPQTQQQVSNTSSTSSNSFSTDLILPSKQITNQSGSNLQKLTSENFNDHVEGIDAELNWLQDQFYGSNFNIDPSTIYGIFSGDNQFIIPDGTAIDPSPTASSEQPKAIMDGGTESTTNNMVDNNKVIKHEEESNSSLFEGIDFNQIGNDTKDILSDFTSDIDSSTFN